MHSPFDDGDIQCDTAPGGGWLSHAESLPLSCFCTQLTAPWPRGLDKQAGEFLPLGRLWDAALAVEFCTGNTAGGETHAAVHPWCLSGEAEAGAVWGSG